MKILKILFVCLVSSMFLASCNGNMTDEALDSSKDHTVKKTLTEKESLRIEELWEKVTRAGLHTQERQAYLDSILMIKPDSAYFWQQKAMPYYKSRKYSLGKPFLAKAVEHDPRRYLEYSAFMKCIFSKEYWESISEFAWARESFGEGYVMDHTYNFYTGLDYLQLNEFEKAKEFLEKSRDQQFSDFPNDSPEEACHYLDWFYLGVVDYELGNYKEAIASLDKSLSVYTNFADAMYFKALCLFRSGLEDEAREWVGRSKENASNTINEDQVFYEIYPYQVFHRLSPKTQMI